jgi:hypothetical protein
MKKENLHKNFILIHRFLHNTPMKKWVEDDVDQKGHYHDDWNVLMEVIDKIELVGFSIEISGEIVVVFDRENVKEIIEEQGATRLEATYKAVVSFIKFFNIWRGKKSY